MKKLWKNCLNLINWVVGTTLLGCTTWFGASLFRNTDVSGELDDFLPRSMLEGKFDQLTEGRWVVSGQQVCFSIKQVTNSEIENRWKQEIDSLRQPSPPESHVNSSGQGPALIDPTIWEFLRSLNKQRITNDLTLYSETRSNLRIAALVDRSSVDPKLVRGFLAIAADASLDTNDSQDAFSGQWISIEPVDLKIATNSILPESFLHHRKAYRISNSGKQNAEVHQIGERQRSELLNQLELDGWQLFETHNQVVDKKQQFLIFSSGQDTLTLVFRSEDEDGGLSVFSTLTTTEKTGI